MRIKRNTAYLALRLPQNEADAIKKAADDWGQPVSMWLREAARSKLRRVTKEGKDND